MKLSRFRLLLATIISGGCLAIAATDAVAQAFPTRPMRLLIPYAPGGPTDILGRVIAQKLSELLPEPMLVENRPGGTGMIAHAAASKAPADGYTLLFSDMVAGFAVNPILFAKTVQYNPRTDLVAIGNVASGTVFLYVSAALPVKSVQDLIALAKSKPGELTFGSAGTGHFPTHIGAELFKIKNGLNLVHVPYKGAGPAMIDLGAGRISFFMTNVGTAKPFLDSGKVRALALTGKTRAAVAPDVPTFAEAGSPLPEMDFGSVWGIVGPAGTPRNAVVRLNTAINRALAQPDTIARFASLNVDAMPGTPEAFAELINSQMETWTQVLNRANIKTLD